MLSFIKKLWGRRNKDVAVTAEQKPALPDKPEKEKIAAEQNIVQENNENENELEHLLVDLEAYYRQHYQPGDDVVEESTSAVNEVPDSGACYCILPDISLDMIIAGNVLSDSNEEEEAAGNVLPDSNEEEKTAGNVFPNVREEEETAGNVLPDGNLDDSTVRKPVVVSSCPPVSRSSKRFPEGLTEFKDLDELLHKQQVTFAQYLNDLMLARRLDAVTVYKRSNIDKRLFSRLFSDRKYKPSKNTVLALIVGMKLGMGEAKELLSYAGFAFSCNSKTDVIVSYFIEKQYVDKDVDLVNQILYRYGEKALGSKTRE